MTRELLGEQGLSVDDDGFEVLMEQQRDLARAGGGGAVDDDHEAVISIRRGRPADPLRRLRGPRRADQRRRGRAVAGAAEDGARR